MVVKNFFWAALASAAVFLCSCSDGKASANGDYVKASETLEKALSLFDCGNYAEAAKLAKEADEKVSGILKKHPESDVAFKIVSDDNLNLGDVKYSNFKKSILPKLSIAADPDFTEIDIAFAIALFNGGCLDLVSLINDDVKNNPSKAKPERAENIYDKLLSDVYPQGDSKNTEARAIILKSKECLKELPPKKETAEKRDARVSASRAFAAPLPQIKDSQKFLKEAEKNASMANYNLEASKALLEASKFVGKTSAEFEAFSKNLKVALSNVKKISSKKLRLPALKNIILAMSQIGLNADALMEVETNSDCADMRQDCYAAISQNLMLSGNLKDAEAVMKKIENPRTKNIFYACLAESFLERKDFVSALRISNEIKSGAMESKILMEQAVGLWDADNGKALEILAKINPQGLAVADLDKLRNAANIPQNGASNLPAARYVEVARLLAKSNKDAALKWLGVGVALSANAKGKDSVLMAGEICGVLIFINPKDAVLYAQKMRGILAFDDIKNLASSAMETGAKEEALEFFKMASSKVLKPKDAVSLAYAMQTSNISRDKVVEILKPHLPKFN